MDKEIIKHLDLVGYETLLEFIEKHELYKLEGDILEIGAFLGGGTAKLAKFAMKHNKKVYTVDIFDPKVDTTQNLHGLSMSQIYSLILQGKRQRDIFNKVVQGYDNVEVISKDSKKLKFPEDQKFCFSFIDGNHSPEYVKNDFMIAWEHTTPGGGVGFHDYEGDIPETTEAINEIIKDHENEIEVMEKVKEKWVLLLLKRAKK